MSQGGKDIGQDIKRNPGRSDAGDGEMGRRCESTPVPAAWSSQNLGKALTYQRYPSFYHFNNC
jgi:hypothetical protein